jgi:RimJ/RimL family protein N-acetyltransferase
MKVELHELNLPADRDSVIGFLSSGEWPFHSAARLDPAEVADRLASGLYAPPGAAAWWISIRDEPHAGIVSVDELEDDAPMLDLRIAGPWRNLGLGRQALALATDRVFASHQAIRRIEGTTRADNFAMQRVFDSCGYTQEARYREAWPAQGGDYLDSLGYAILRREWKAGGQAGVR